MEAKLREYFSKLLESDDALEHFVGAVLLGKTLDNKAWTGLAGRIIDEVEKRLPATDELARNLLAKSKQLLEDGVLTGDDLATLAFMLATRNSMPEWVKNIVEHGLKGNLDRKDFVDPLADFVERHVGVDSALVLKSLISDGKVSRWNWQILASIALYRFGLLEAPSDSVDRDALIAALAKALAKKDAQLAEKLKALLDAMAKGDHIAAFKTVLAVAGVDGLPEVLNSLLDKKTLKEAFTNQVKSWLDAQNDGADFNKDLASAMVEVLLGNSKLFNVESDVEAWAKTGLLNDDNRVEMYSKICRLRKVVFAGRLIKSTGSVVSITADAPPLLLGLWSAPSDTLQELIGNQQAVDVFRVLLQAEFFVELKKDSHGNVAAPVLQPSTTLAQTMMYLNNSLRQ